MYSRSDVGGRRGGAVPRVLGQWVAVLPGPSKGTQPCCRRVVRSLAIAPAVDMVHRVWPMTRERSIGENPGYPVVLVVSGCVMNPVSVMPESSICSTSAPGCGPSGDCAATPGVTGAPATGPVTWSGTTIRCEPGQ